MTKCDNCLELKLAGLMECSCHNEENVHCEECHGDCRCLDWEG